MLKSRVDTPARSSSQWYSSCRCSSCKNDISSSYYSLLVGLRNLVTLSNPHNRSGALWKKVFTQPNVKTEQKENLSLCRSRGGTEESGRCGGPIWLKIALTMCLLLLGRGRVKQRWAGWEHIFWHIPVPYTLKCCHYIWHGSSSGRDFSKGFVVYAPG